MSKARASQPQGHVAYGSDPTQAPGRSAQAPGQVSPIARCPHVGARALTPWQPH